jgi:ribosome recycling factor
MAYDFSSFSKKTRDVQEWLARELSGLRTGRAAPAILDGVIVEAYGAKMPIKQVAAITVEDARTLRVSPWDASQAKAIEKAISSSSLGLSAVSGENGIRVIFPELSAERRSALIKTAKSKVEEARVSLRRARDEENKAIDAKEKSGGMGEDEKFRIKKELDKLSDGENKKLEESLARKEKEINS